jgi:hypothetical protein
LGLLVRACGCQRSCSCGRAVIDLIVVSLALIIFIVLARVLVSGPFILRILRFISMSYRPFRRTCLDHWGLVSTFVGGVHVHDTSRLQFLERPAIFVVYCLTPSSSSWCPVGFIENCVELYLCHDLCLVFVHYSGVCFFFTLNFCRRADCSVLRLRSAACADYAGPRLPSAAVNTPNLAHVNPHLELNTLPYNM